ncbi:hypothetical protein GCM10010911_57060 [Paenibacillus nasutitermitis]|uniref:Uncharacterized protein n=1 Tax=Paenibacillus nasutitermitis TaxID=1652958 RepID=A0A916ZED1_9BACL|nr:hypothetical protein GCM10010911_57060 [Paenibacillus nasutitermitis]
MQEKSEGIGIKFVHNGELLLMIIWGGLNPEDNLYKGNIALLMFFIKNKIKRVQGQIHGNRLAAYKEFFISISSASHWVKK